jgi:hypothetical protein
VEVPVERDVSSELLTGVHVVILVEILVDVVHLVRLGVIDAVAVEDEVAILLHEA